MRSYVHGDHRIPLNEEYGAKITFDVNRISPLPI